MKKYLLIFIILFSFVSLCFAQSKYRKIPSVNVKTLDGSMFNTGSISNNGKPIVISFWATWCKPCIKELSNIADVYEDWQDETGVLVIALSIDDARNTAKVGPFVNGKGWDFDVYLDPNSDFRRAMGVNMTPHTFLINGNMEIVWEHTSYSEGDEEELFELIKKVAAGENIE